MKQKVQASDTPMLAINEVTGEKRYFTHFVRQVVRATIFF